MDTWSYTHATNGIFSFPHFTIVPHIKVMMQYSTLNHVETADLELLHQPACSGILCNETL
jgi:hypothetical protein